MFLLKKKFFNKIIDKTRDNDIIRLPEKCIKISNLYISKPLKIIGSNQSVIEINEGSIVIDINSKDEEKKVIFSECSFNFDLNRFLETSRSKSL